MTSTTQIKQMKPKVGDYCVLTADGVNARRTRNRIRNAGIGATVGWFALPFIIPGEAIGIAGASTFGVSEAAQAAVGSAIGGITGANFVKELASGMVGEVVSINYDKYPQIADVVWRWKQEDGAIKIVHKKHKLEHLQKIECVDTPKQLP